MAKKTTKTLLTNILKSEIPKSLSLNNFEFKEAYDIYGNFLPNHVAIYTKRTTKARVLVLSVLSPKTWIEYLIAGANKK